MMNTATASSEARKSLFYHFSFYKEMKFHVCILTFISKTNTTSESFETRKSLFFIILFLKGDKISFLVEFSMKMGYNLDARVLFCCSRVT